MAHSAPAPNSGPSALHLQGKVSTTTPGKTGAMTGDVRPHRRRRGGLAASDADRSVRLVQLGPCSPGTGRQKVHGTRPSLQFDPSRLLVGPSRPASFLSVLFSGCGRFSSRSDSKIKKYRIVDKSQEAVSVGNHRFGFHYIILLEWCSSTNLGYLILTSNHSDPPGKYHGEAGNYHCCNVTPLAGDLAAKKGSSWPNTGAGFPDQGCSSVSATATRELALKNLQLWQSIQKMFLHLHKTRF